MNARVDLDSGEASTVAALVRELERSTRAEVRFDAGSRALYATDASNYRQVPIGVVVPRSIDDVVATVAACRRYGAPVLSRGGGTSLAGQCCNVAVVLDFSKYLNRIVEIDPGAKTAIVEPGCVLDDLRNAAEQHHLTFAPDPATHSHNTLGGMIGNNSCGVHSIMGGKTVENVIALEILLYDGTRMTVGATDDDAFERIVAAGGRRGDIYARLKALRDAHAAQIRARYPDIPRRVSGFNLDQLLPENGFHVARALVGSEGTCAVVLRATLRLVDSPRARTLLVLGWPDAFQAADHVPQVLAQQPIALEGFDDGLVQDMKAVQIHPQNADLLPEGKGWLLVEFGGDDKAQSGARARACMEALRRTGGDGKDDGDGDGDGDAPSMKLFDDEDETKAVWKVRESALGATAHIPHKRIAWPGWEDAAVPPDRTGDYLRDFRQLTQRYGYQCAVYGHFGQGCLHTRIDFDLKTSDGIETFRRFIDDAADLVVRYGGSLSGEHGDGQARAQLLPKMFGDELVQAFRDFKSIWDPDWKMNPGKVVDANAPTENLRLGPDYRPPQPVTFFKFPADDHDIGRVALRCVGVGNCRQHEHQTMCPSYKATREERHSTRGRARLLFEALQGDVIKDGWQSEEVKEALDLCLACKGCKGDCPVRVDMASYKAEFLAHYFEHRHRPRQAYAFGWIDRWARLAQLAPGLLNWITHAPVLGRVAKAVAGMPQQRSVPSFAQQTFLQWFAGRPIVNAGRPRVLLWPDTFNNHFHPEVARAAVAVLEAAGFRVTVPKQHLCCGRPLYDWGMLDQAQRQLRQIMAVLERDIDDGICVVGLEPSCVAVFRDELTNLFAHDELAKRLSAQTYFFSEFMQKKAPDFDWPTLAGTKAVLHGHCNQKALVGTAHDEAVLKDRLGLELQTLDSGCCGMAGSFGFEKQKYDVSIAIGELALLPAVRATAQHTLILTDGYSCREQIAQTCQRRAMHTAEAIELALRRAGRLEPAGSDAVVPAARRPPAIGNAAVLAAIGLAAVAVATARQRRRGGRRAGLRAAGRNHDFSH